MKKLMREILPAVLMFAIVVYLVGWTVLSRRQWSIVRETSPSMVRLYEKLMKKQKGNEKFVLIKDVFVSKQRQTAQTGPNSVTLATQTFVDNLHLLETLANRWKGPISVAVFIDRNDREMIQLVRYYYQCFRAIQANTSFHIMCPYDLDISYVPLACGGYRRDIRNKDYQTKLVEGMEYPHNLMRNLAVPDSKEGFVFCIDIDMVPSWNLRENFIKFTTRLAKSTLESSIFIVPSFESMDLDVLPLTRGELLEGLTGREIQIFHEKSCAKCQFDTNYNKWMNVSSSAIYTYRVRKTFCSYEPFYIMSRKKFIPYDERFIGRGYDRISQVCEVWMAGFDFLVLSDVFVVHRGFHAPIPPPPPHLDPSLNLTTIGPEVYKQRHLDFLRAKYLSDGKYRKKIQQLYNETVIRNLERRLSMYMYNNQDVLQKTNLTNKIQWVQALKGSDIMQYQWYMKFGEKGPTEEQYENGDWREPDLVNKKSLLRWEAKIDPRDPNKVTFFKFLRDKWKIYTDDSRKTCKI